MAVRVGHPRPAGGYDVTEVPLEEYVARVLAGEAAARSAPAALDALAIAVRTFAIANLGRHRGDGFDLCDLTHCQVMATSTPATRQAAAATAGQILTYRDQPAAIFYTASCGGQSELPSEVWPRAQDQPFLTRHKDKDCKRLPEWTAEIEAPELLRALNAAGLKGDRIRNVRVARRSGSGRAATLRIEGLDPDEITGDDLRSAVGRALGSQLLRSTAFDVERTPAGFRFTGRGMGHGVGMCVVGSAKMAAEGQSATTILAEYFPGTRIAMLPSAEAAGAARPLPPPAEPERPRPAPFPTPSRSRPAPAVPAPAPPRTVSQVRLQIELPARDPEEGPALVPGLDGMVRRNLADIADRVRVPLPVALHVVFHPTIDSYSAKTGLPWWTAGATSADRIDLLPLPLLQERGILERTIRHEIAHVLSAPLLERRPAWVREGAAVYLSGERADPPATTGGGVIRCPSDGELLRSQSAASFHDAYLRAAACYAARIAAGKKWNEIK